MRHQFVDSVPALGNAGIHVYHLVKRLGFRPGLKRSRKIAQIALHKREPAKRICKLKRIFSASPEELNRLGIKRSSLQRSARLAQNVGQMPHVMRRPQLVAKGPEHLSRPAIMRFRGLLIVQGPLHVSQLRVKFRHQPWVIVAAALLQRFSKRAACVLEASLMSRLAALLNQDLRRPLLHIRKA